MYQLFTVLPNEMKQEIVFHLDNNSYLCLRIAFCQQDYNQPCCYTHGWTNLNLAVQMIPRFIQKQLIEPNLDGSLKIIKIETPLMYEPSVYLPRQCWIGMHLST